MFLWYLVCLCYLTAGGMRCTLTSSLSSCPGYKYHSGIHRIKRERTVIAKKNAWSSVSSTQVTSTIIILVHPKWVIIFGISSLFQFYLLFAIASKSDNYRKVGEVITVQELFSPFLIPPKKRRKKKKRMNIKNRNQKSCLSARYYVFIAPYQYLSIFDI